MTHQQKKKKEYNQRYRAKHAEKIKAWKRLYRQRNKESMTEYQRKYRRENKDKVNARKREYNKRKPEKSLQKHRRTIENLPDYYVKRILSYDGITTPTQEMIEQRRLSIKLKRLKDEKLRQIKSL